MLCWRLHALPQPASRLCLVLSPLAPPRSLPLRSLTSGVGLRVLTLLSGPVPSLHRVCLLLLLLRGLPILVLPAVCVWLTPSGSVTLLTPLLQAPVLGGVSPCAVALLQLTRRTFSLAPLLLRCGAATTCLCAPFVLTPCSGASVLVCLLCAPVLLCLCSSVLLC